MKYDDFTWNDIVLEAPGDDIEGEELSATDYTEAEDMDIEESDPLSDDTTDPTDEDPLGDENDPTDDDPLSDDDSDSTDEQTDNADESDVTTDKQNKNLVNDFIELYTRINTIMNQIKTDCKTNIRYNPNMQVVRKNLTKLKMTTYDYIVNRFTKESYVSNLYQFNLIIQALNVNIDLLSSVMASNRKFKEEKNKNKKKK